MAENLKGQRGGLAALQDGLDYVGSQKAHAHHPDDVSRADPRVYFILKSMEIGTSFRSTMPKYPTGDPDYRILSRQRSRYAHYYFYVRDPVLGPIALCVGSFLPFRSPQLEVRLRGLARL
jgi:hypothetical protein